MNGYNLKIYYIYFLMNLSDLVKEYFLKWNSKDIKGLSNLFSENINLRDWNIDIKGFDNVLEANVKIFNDVPEINAEIVNLFESKNSKTVVAELIINLNKNESIKVVDIISFNNNNKIKSIMAYKG